MVGNITSLTNNGLRDWLIQRVTAVILGTYTTYLLIFFLTHPNLTFQQWYNLFDCMAMKIASVMTILSVILHAWIGIWTVTTDYIKCTRIRLPLQILIILGLIVLFIWVLAIIWSI